MDSLKSLFLELYKDLYDYGPSELLYEKLRVLLQMLGDVQLTESEAGAAAHLMLLIKREKQVPAFIKNRAEEYELKLLRMIRDSVEEGEHLEAETESGDLDGDTEGGNESRKAGGKPWENAYEMFGDNFLTKPDGSLMTIEELKSSGLQYVDVKVITPTGSTPAEIFNVRYHSSGEVERIPVYSIQPKPVSGSDQLWNDYTQKFMNDIDMQSSS